MREFSITVGKHQFAGLEWGNPDGPILLALHGWLDNAASFIPLADKMVSTGLNHRFIAIDLLGHGASSHKDSYYHFVDWVDDLYQLIQSAGWGKVDLLGHSMGAMISSIFAATFPECVNKLLLIEGIGGLTTEPAQCSTQLREGIISRHQQNMAREKYIPRDIPLDTAVKARMRISDLSAENATLIIERNIKQVDGLNCWASDQKLTATSVYRFSQEQIVVFLAQLSMPCLIILGENGFDKLKNVIKHPVFNQQNFNTRVVGGGHHLHMEQPEVLGNILSDFVT